MTIDLNVRNTDLGALVQQLQNQQARRLDMTVPAHRINSINGNLVLDGLDVVMDEDGVTDPNGLYRPTTVFHEGVAEKLGIPVGYVKRMAAERPDLYDANVNGWLQGNIALGGDQVEDFTPDTRTMLLRLWKPTVDDTDTGVARALLSEKYRMIDHLDVLMASLDGIREAGVDIQFSGADLTDRRMVVRIAAPEIQALAPELLAGYRSPFTGESGSDNPTVFAGLVLSNSETGGGAFTITPRLTVQVCNNGMTITKDAAREVHLGGKLDSGVIRWSEEAQEQNLRLMKVKARDTVASFLDVDYMKRVIADLTEKAGVKVEAVDDVKDVTRRAGYTGADIDGILSHFVQGGQMTRGGIMHAATAYAQTVEDADSAYDVEQRATLLLTA